MKRMGVVANCDKPVSAEVLKRLAVKAKALDWTLVTCDRTGDQLPDAVRVAPETLGTAVDTMLALGGDGTMLHVVRLLNGADTPVLGVNMGSLGFMTSVTLDRLEEALDIVASGRHHLSARTLLSARIVRAGKDIAQFVSLNDIVVSWGRSSRALSLGISIDDVDVAQYLCDGIVISSPTGSTGHSLSAGGPIVHPEAPVIVVTALCAHTLSARPLVLPDDRRVRIRIVALPENKHPLLSADGQGDQVMNAGDELEVQRYPHRVHFIHLPDYRYFSVLRQKLHWHGSVK